MLDICQSWRVVVFVDPCHSCDGGGDPWDRYIVNSEGSPIRPPLLAFGMNLGGQSWDIKESSEVKPRASTSIEVSKPGFIDPEAESY